MMKKLLGEGWELSAFKEGGRLLVSIPVESGFVTKSFDFDISEENLSVLKESRYRRLTLSLLLHEMLQPRLTRGDVGATDKECKAMITIILHGSVTAIERAIGASPNAESVRIRLEQAGFYPYKGREVTTSS